MLMLRIYSSPHEQTAMIYAMMMMGDDTAVTMMMAAKWFEYNLERKDDEGRDNYHQTQLSFGLELMLT